MNKLSHSSVSTYLTCSYCYYLRYIENIRPVKVKSALLFGKALDDAFNVLLLEKDLDKAKTHFYKSWSTLHSTPMIFRKNEADLELIEHFGSNICYKKEEWQTLLFKGELFIQAYFEKVLPKIKEVITVQEPFTFKNTDGDEIYGIIDLIVKWEDGKTYLLDNKTSSFKYSKDDAKQSQQLSLYHYVINEKYKLDGIGFIVLDKNINKNKVMTCETCGVKTENTRLKTCAETTLDHGRCGGPFKIELKPSVDVEFIFDKIDLKFQDNVIGTFDKANECISKGIYGTKHTFGKYGPCDLFKYYEGNPDFYKKVRK